jgi:UDP-glucose 4-epimerase
MKILLTGSTGFVGRHLVSLIENNGYELHHLLRAEKGFQHEHIWDFSEPLPGDLPECDIVLHLAASVNFATKIEINEYIINTSATAELVKYSLKTGALFIFASSVAVHGNTGHFSVNSPVAPGNHYALSKFLAEQVIHTFLDNAVILRICGIYGLDGPSHLGLNTAISNAVHHKSLPFLSGTGQGRRNYICIDDVVHWILYLIKRWDKEAGAGDTRGVKTLYLASSESMSIEEYLQCILNVFFPGEKFQRQKGPQSEDCLVEPSPAPFPLTSFNSYLTGLKRKCGNRRTSLA